MIWVTSDLHYNHKNLCRGVSSWENNEKTTRDFKTLEEMNDAIVNSINNCVQQDDELYFLGDWSMAGIDNIWEFRRRITCKIIHFITGNHDKAIKNNVILPNCSLYPGGSFVYNSMSYYQFGVNSVSNCHAQDLFTTVQPYLELNIGKQLFILSHYPLEQWMDMERGSIHLHGHCHHTLDGCEINTKYRRMDVGIDWKEFRPYSLDEILEVMNKREFKKHINKL